MFKKWKCTVLNNVYYNYRKSGTIMEFIGWDGFK